MTSTTQKPKEAKLQHSIGNPKPLGKEYSVDELFLLQQLFAQIEKCNLKRSAPVDYWISKNEKLLGDAWKKFKADEKALYKDTAEVFVHPTLKDAEKRPEEYFYVIGDPNRTDVQFVLNDFAFYQLEFHEPDKPTLTMLQKQTWTQVIPATEEGKEPTTNEMPYKYKFKSDAHMADFEKRFEELKQSKYPVELYLLKEENLEGLNIVWKDIQKDDQGRSIVTNDLTQFRDLLYDNAIL